MDQDVHISTTSTPLGFIYMSPSELPVWDIAVFVTFYQVRIASFKIFVDTVVVVCGIISQALIKAGIELEIHNKTHVRRQCCPTDYLVHS